MSVRVITGDCRDVLAALPDKSVHCVVTSPPYWRLRDYGCVGQIGLEATFDEFVAELVDVFREVRRALRSDGTLWLNLGDAYAGSWGAQSRGAAPSDKSTLQGNGHTGGGPKLKSLSAVQIAAHPKGTGVGSIKRTPALKPKDLIGLPWRVAFALQADGWWLRQDIIWSKPNPMPESVTDRCTKAHEYLFLLTKSERYYFDQEAIMEPVTASTIERLSQPTLEQQGILAGSRQNEWPDESGMAEGPRERQQEPQVRFRIRRIRDRRASHQSGPDEDCQDGLSGPQQPLGMGSRDAALLRGTLRCFSARADRALHQGRMPKGRHGPRPIRRRRDDRPGRRSARPQRHPNRTQSRIRRDGRAPDQGRCRHVRGHHCGGGRMTDIIRTVDKLKCAERELEMRRRVYPRWTEDGRMSAGKAAHEIAAMEAIVADYKAAVEKELLI